MKILIDADGCPVVDCAVKVAEAFKVEVKIFCDTAHCIERKGIVTEIISKGTDAVDFKLVNEVQQGDIVITQDYGLAAMVLSKKGCAVNQNGLVFSEHNIDQLLFTRHLGKEVRMRGGHTKGPKKRKKEDDLHFEEVFRRLIVKALNPS